MEPDTRPVLIAYDGSPASESAVRAAVGVFTGRHLIVASVWEPGLAYAMAPVTDATGIGYLPPLPDEVATIDRAQHDHARNAALAGAQHAREAGADAEAAALAGDGRVADALVDYARERDACAIVIGSRGLGGVRSLFGSTSRALLHEADRPVLVVRAPEPADG